MITRTIAKKEIVTALNRRPVVALLGPRQCGKTTLARTFVPAGTLNYFDLENPISSARLAEPMTALSDLRGLIVIDEIQSRPELFPILRVLADRDENPAQFLILGSASPTLIRHTSETLAGRVETINLSPFVLHELGVDAMNKHWLRGGYPPAYLAKSDEDSNAWKKNFVQTFLERDVPLMGFNVPPTDMHRFWTMLAHYHGGTWNGSEIARSMGVSESTVRRYLELLNGLFMLRVLLPWHANLMKRQVKSPKVYVRDSGLLHSLLGIRTDLDLLSHPKCGASWEGYAIEQVLSVVRPNEAYFWATHQGAELDLLMLKDGRRYGVELKRSDAPRLTTSMKIAMEDLDLEHLTVLYPGELKYPLHPKVTAVPIKCLSDASIHWPPSP